MQTACRSGFLFFFSDPLIVLNATRKLKMFVSYKNWLRQAGWKYEN